MNQSNIDFLEANRDAYTEIVNAETATKANKIKADLFRIIKEEFLPGYSYSDDCGPCLFDMTRLLYRYFDEWKAKQPVIVAASFPSHKEEVPPVLTPVIPSKQENKNHKRR